jgi:hypothetical protein
MREGNGDDVVMKTGNVGAFETAMNSGAAFLLDRKEKEFPSQTLHSI